MEVVGFDAAKAPKVAPLASPPPPPADAGGGSSGAPMATKRGAPVTLSVRRMRNHTFTFVDGLEDWGYDKEVYIFAVAIEWLACNGKGLRPENKTPTTTPFPPVFQRLLQER